MRNPEKKFLGKVYKWPKKAGFPIQTVQKPGNSQFVQKYLYIFYSKTLELTLDFV